jgi:peptidoglycan-associated lipoprotein
MTLRLIGLGLCLALAAAGCARRPAVTEISAPAPTGGAAETAPAPPPPPPAPTRVEATPAPAEAKPAPAPTPEPAPTPPAPVAAAREEARSFAPVDAVADIHFDFDRSDIRPQDEKILERSARWLTERADYLVLIEGHCDERGTNEYNLALGERRASAARDFLVRRGIAASRITTISYGEERPQCTARNEDCWGRNRRAHFLVKRR